ncbi:MAG: hypothetical protein AVDCRST_MAG30-3436 [uncultured Solirubrobacteraceae bacterium]|uniref:Uncharacterized protein n=1 Tax=uncultured Solirubrobacteraceae bacterium TaxID=1162706 RepID=A0A6J4TN79_9ACTN|nr:MAG: hypothetical protein AVDCRST_MAG30-3436 [uncultured Solirubrobacteraceae bacterium]
MAPDDLGQGERARAEHDGEQRVGDADAGVEHDRDVRAGQHRVAQQPGQAAEPQRVGERGRRHHRQRDPHGGLHDPPAVRRRDLGKPGRPRRRPQEPREQRNAPDHVHQEQRPRQRGQRLRHRHRQPHRVKRDQRVQQREQRPQHEEPQHEDRRDEHRPAQQRQEQPRPLRVEPRDERQRRHKRRGDGHPEHLRTVGGFRVSGEALAPLPAHPRRPRGQQRDHGPVEHEPRHAALRVGPGGLPLPVEGVAAVLLEVAPRLGAEPPADADVHRLDELAVLLLEHALDPDVGDLLLRAARRAAREVHPQVVAVAVGPHVRVEELGDLERAVLRVDLREPAELLARAGLQPAREELGLGGQALVDRLGLQRRDAVVRDERDDHVLLVGEPQLAVPGAVLAGQAAELAQLRGLQAADGDREAHRGVLAVVLRGDADVVVPAHVGLVRSGAAQVAADLGDERLAEALGGHRVDQELDARAGAAGAVLLGVAEDPRRRGDHLGHLVGLEEDVERARHARGGGEPAADAQVEAARPVGVDRARQRDVVDQPARAVLRAARHGDLVLARQVRVEPVVEEVVVQRLGGRVAVDGQAAGVEPGEDVGDVLEPDPVDLHALARRAVDDPAPVVLGDRGERVDLLARQHALDDLHAEHEVPVLRVVRVQPVPLQAGRVVVVEGLPALGRRAHQVGVDVEAVLLLLHPLELVHDEKCTKPGSDSGFFVSGGGGTRAARAN